MISKKIISTSLAILMALSLTACGTATSSTPTSSAVTTTSADASKNPSKSDELSKEIYTFKAGKYDVKLIETKEFSSENDTLKGSFNLTTDKGSTALATPSTSETGISLNSKDFGSHFEILTLTKSDKTTQPLIIFKSLPIGNDLPFATFYTIDTNGIPQIFSSVFPEITGEITVDGLTCSIKGKDTKYTFNLETYKITEK